MIRRAIWWVVMALVAWPILRAAHQMEGAISREAHWAALLSAVAIVDIIGQRSRGAGGGK